MQDLLSIGTNRRESMIGTGIGLGLAGYRLRTSFEAMPSLDLQFADRRMIQAVLGPTPSFSRASTGTFFNSQGVLTSAAVNVPRFNHTYNGTSWVSRGLLVEEQRTNVNLWSNSFDNAAYAKEACTVSANADTAPDGTLTADKIIPDATNNDHSIYNVVANASYTISVYAKAAGYNYLFIGKNNSAATDGVFFDLSNGTISQNTSGGTASIVPVGNGWYRCIHTPTTATQYPIFCTSANGTSFVHIGDGTSGVLLWGAQAEVGSFATSIIPTTSSSVTRSADVCQITGSDFSGFYNQSEGSFVGEYEVFNTSSLSFLSQIDDSTNTNRFYFAGTRANSKNGFSVIGAVTGGQDFDCSTVSPNSLIKIAVGLKAQNYQAYSGSSSVSDAVEGLPNATLNRMQIGQRAGDFFLNGHIARLRYYPVRLSNAKLQELST